MNNNPYIQIFIQKLTKFYNDVKIMLKVMICGF